MIASSIWDHVTVTVIDKRDYFETITGSIKGAVDHPLLDDMLAMNDKTAAAYQKITFKQANLLKVHKAGNFIDVQNLTTATPERIDFDVLIICTGFSYQGPIRGEATSLKDRKGEFEAYWKQIDDAKHIAIVGGGIVGVELAAEYAVHFQENKIDKKVTIYSASPLLSSLPPKAGVLAEEFFKAYDVKIMKERFDDKVEHPDTLVIKCTGYNYPTDFMKEDFSDCLASNGQIYVNDLFQVSAKNPRVNSLADGVCPNIFAFGDVCYTSLNELKSVPSMAFMRDILVNNVLQIARSQRPSNQIPERLPELSSVSLGPRQGIMILNGLVNLAADGGKLKF